MSTNISQGFHPDPTLVLSVSMRKSRTRLVKPVPTYCYIVVANSGQPVWSEETIRSFMHTDSRVLQPGLYYQMARVRLLAQPAYDSLDQIDISTDI